MLVSGGLDPYAVIVVEAGHAADPAGYRAGLAAYANGGVSGVSGWIIACAAAVARGAELSPAAIRRKAERADRTERDAAPTVVGAVPGTSAASDQACFVNVLAPASRGRNCPFGDG